MTRTSARALVALGLLGLLGVVALAFFVAPDAANFQARLTQRIFYFHVPSAWVAYLAFTVTAYGSARFLASRDARHDRLAAASAEVGLVFSAIALVTGVVWSSVEFFGSYSPFTDAKVVTLVVVILAYLAYLTLRSGVDDPQRRGRLSAVFGLLAFAGVPLSYLASKVSLHPDFTRPDESLSAELGMILGVSVMLITLLYAALTAHRLRLLEIEDALADVRARAGEA